ncbi:hypothetical protein M3Y96_01079200 [Aphelenchoides besseyi]|nr:hypothetical protein M3Y96_01079200 [Aphelenchoides besseyi]
MVFVRPEGVTCLEDWISYTQMLDDVQQPLSRVRSPVYPMMNIEELRPATELIYSPFRWPTPPPKSPPKWERPLGPLELRDVPRLHSPPSPMPNPCTSTTSVLETIELRNELKPIVEPMQSTSRGPRPSPLNLSVEMEETFSPSDSSFANSPLFDIDLGAYELLDSGMSAEALLSQEDPVIFHRDMPVHSVHHDTVQTEAALENLMNAPESMLSTTVPPAMVADNYCFICDGDKIKMADLMADDHFWRHTSRPTKYFYSEVMIEWFSKIISAKLATTTPMSGGASLGVPADREPGPPPTLTPTSARAPTSSSLPVTAVTSSATTPRSSMISTTTKAQRGEKMPLEHVYKVIRFYSFWKTCTSFHRIVTMIDRIVPADRNDNVPTNFKRRLFVQYLWRNAKPSEKARVQKEFDPRRQRLLRFVTSPADRNRRNEAYANRSPDLESLDSEDSESLIEFPVSVSIKITKARCEQETPTIKYHVSRKDCSPIPIYNFDGKPFDVNDTLFECPLKFVAKTPPDQVFENFCFVVDGDSVPEESITSGEFWRPTSIATRFYCSENQQMKKFKKVNVIFFHGNMHAAFANRNNAAGMIQIPLSKIFRVTRCNGRLRRLAGRAEVKDDWTQEKNELERKNRLLAQKNIADKTTIIRLNRELRDLREQAEILRFEAEHRKQQIDKLQTAYDNLDEELTNTRHKLREFEDSTHNLRADALRSNETSHASAQIAEQELRMFERETTKQSVLPELSQLKQFEDTIQLLQKQNAEIEERRSRAEAERSKLSSKYKRLKSKLEKMNSSIEHRSALLSQLTIPATVEIVQKETEVQTKTETQTNGRSSAKPTLGILDRLYDDVGSLVELGRSSSSGSAQKDDEYLRDVKWQEMYESTYNELEKTRNMVIVEYDINRELKEENSKLNKELETQQRRYEAEIVELQSQISRFRREIQILENQLRAVAGGELIVGSTSTLTDKTMRTGEMDITVRFSRLSVTTNGLKRTTTATPSFFLLLEFFDFDFQITPPIQGPDATIQFSTVYEIIVSDLFIHYLQTDGIHIELYEVLGTTYNLWGSGKISLRSLLSAKPAPINEKLEVTSDDGDVVTLLDYSVEIPDSLAQALYAQKRRQTAATFLPLDGDVSNENDRCHLVIEINRIHDLQRLLLNNDIRLRSSTAPKVYVVYQFFDLPFHSTSTAAANWNPKFNDRQTWSLPIGSSLHRYLKAESLEFQVDGSTSESQLEVSIYWKQPYTYSDEHLEVVNLEESQKQNEQASITTNPSIANPIKNTVQTRDAIDDSKREDESVSMQRQSTTKQQPTPKPQEQSAELPESTTTSTETSQKSEDKESVIVVGSPDLRDADEQYVPSIPQPIPRQRGVDANELRRRLSQEFGLDEEPATAPRKYDPDVDDAPLSVVPSTAPAIPLSVVPSSVEIEPPTFSDSDEGSDSTYTAENPNNELSRPRIEDFPDDLVVESDEDEAAVAPQPAQRNLPPLAVRGRGVEFTEPLHSSIPPSETSSFADASNGDEFGDSLTPAPRRVPRPQPRLSTNTSTKSLLRTSHPPTANAVDLPIPDSTVQLKIVRVCIPDHSPLLAAEFDDLNCVVEWSLLDFQRGETHCLPLSRDARQPIEFNVEQSKFLFHNKHHQFSVYQLSWRRISLLRQWMALGTKLKFVLVLEPTTNARTLNGDTADDVAEAALDLQDIVNSRRHIMNFFDVDMEPIATLEVEVELSDAVWQNFEELAAGERPGE